MSLIRCVCYVHFAGETQKEETLCSYVNVFYCTQGGAGERKNGAILFAREG